MQLFESLNECFGNGDLSSKLKGGCGWKELSGILNELLQNLIMLGIFIAIIMILYAGYVLVKGQGSPDSRSKAKKIFMGIVIGLILLVGSYYIVEFILDTLGTDKAYREDVLLR